MITENMLVLIRNGMYSPDTMDMQEIAAELLVAREKLRTLTLVASTKLRCLAEKYGVNPSQVSAELCGAETRLVLRAKDNSMISHYWAYETEAWAMMESDIQHEGRR